MEERAPFSLFPLLNHSTQQNAIGREVKKETPTVREVQKGIAMEPVFIYIKRSSPVQIEGRSNPHPPGTANVTTLLQTP